MAEVRSTPAEQGGQVIGYLGAYHGPDGKRRYVSAKQKSGCERKLREAMTDADRGLIFDCPDLKLGEYLDSWPSNSVKDTIRPRTWERYESICRVHIKPALGRVKLRALTPNHVRGLYRQKLDSGLAPRTVRYIHTTLHKALKEALSDGLISRNVTDAVRSPRPAKPEITPLSQEQARTLLDAASKEGDRFEVLYVVALHCGLREGELLGLKWEDVNLEAGTLAVRRTLSETRTGHKFEKPKNNGKGRLVKLAQRTVEALRKHRAPERGEAKGGLPVAG